MTRARHHLGWIVFAVIILIVAVGRPTTAVASDLESALHFIFDDVLDSALILSPGPHAQHYLPEKVASSERTINALSNFISANTSNFPLSSTAAGVTFDFSTGVPVASMSSSGPVFAEQATTLGRKKLNVGANFSYLDLARLRGIKTQDLSVNLFHQDIADTLFGDSDYEYDYITLNLNMDLNAVVFATYATYGITDRIDVGVAVPIVNVSMKAASVARMNSYTYTSSDSASHYFGGTKYDPVLWHDVPVIDQSASGIGDIAVRAKANFYRSPGGNMAGLLEIRLPTGKAEDFLGAGDPSYKFGVIGSASFGGINPHVNASYNIRTSKIDRNEVELKLGYDQKVGEKLTFAAEWMGSYEVGAQIWDTRFPDPQVISRPDGPNQTIATYYIPSTSIPAYASDNVVNTSFGVKYMPKSNLLLVANVILPVNNGGLRSSVIPTLGLELNM